METVEERAHQNLCDFVRWNGRLHPDTPTLDEAGVAAVAARIDFPTSRTAIRTDHSLPPDRWVELATSFLSTHGKTACIYARIGADDDITEHLLPLGFSEWSTSPEMICEQSLEPREPPAGVTLRFADQPADISAYARIVVEAFAHLHLVEAAALDSVDHPDQFLADDCIVALAEIDGVPVAGAQAVLFDGGRRSYVSWVACADAARGRGLGDTVTRAVTNEAFRRGADLLTLEASHYGEHTYARMGYREIYRYRMLLRL